MLNTALFVIYVTGVILMIWPTRQFLINSIVSGTPETFDKVMGSLLGTLISLFWPCFVVGIVAIKISKASWEKFLGNENERIPHD